MINLKQKFQVRIFQLTLLESVLKDGYFKVFSFSQQK